MFRNKISKFFVFNSVLIVTFMIISGFIFQINDKLIVEVTNDYQGEGKLIAELYNSGEKYLKSPFKEVKVNTNGKNKTEIVFEDITPGVYSLLVYLDANDNGKLDLNFLGIPTEDYGFSNNVRSTLGLPDWGESMFEFGNEYFKLEINLK